MIKAVVFDIGNVLIEWQPKRYYDRVYGPDRRRAAFDAIDLHGMNERVDLGHGFRDVIYAEAEKFPEWRQEIRDWHDHWNELAGPVIDHSVRLLHALKGQGVPVFALSNFGVESYAYAQTLFPVLNEFDREYISGRMKITKPSAEIYQRAAADCGIDPAHLLFADDRAENIEAAGAQGWQTHLFEHAQGWADRLVDEGLLTQEQAQ